MEISEKLPQKLRRTLSELSTHARTLVPPLPWHRPKFIDRGATETVVLLHGLWRSVHAMHAISDSLGQSGDFNVCTVPYASFTRSYDDIVRDVSRSIRGVTPDQRVHLVTHSLGGVVARGLLHSPLLEREIGRVVMLAPPNHGSEIVDWLQGSPLRKVLGPAGEFLASHTDEIPHVPEEKLRDIAVIMGTSNKIKLFSQLLDEVNDGVVSVEKGRIKGGEHFTTLPVDHTFIMNDFRVIKNVSNFLKFGELAQ